MTFTKVGVPRPAPCGVVVSWKARCRRRGNAHGEMGVFRASQGQSKVLVHIIATNGMTIQRSTRCDFKISCNISWTTERAEGVTRLWNVRRFTKSFSYGIGGPYFGFGLWRINLLWNCLNLLLSTSWMHYGEEFLGTEPSRPIHQKRFQSVCF